MQGLLPREPVHQLKDDGSCTIAVEDLLCRLGNHSIDDLGRDGDCGSFVVGYDTEELEIENVERVWDLGDGDLLE